MGLLDSLFGCCKKAETPRTESAAVVSVPVAVAPVAVEPATDNGLAPEVIAAITASIGMMMEDTDSELAAAIAAVILHSKGGGSCRAVSFKRSGNAWSASGRQKIMDSRQII